MYVYVCIFLPSISGQSLGMACGFGFIEKNNFRNKHPTSPGAVACLVAQSSKISHCVLENTSPILGISNSLADSNSVEDMFFLLEAMTKPRQPNLESHLDSLVFQIRAFWLIISVDDWLLFRKDTSGTKDHPKSEGSIKIKRIPPSLMDLSIEFHRSWISKTPQTHPK